MEDYFHLKLFAAVDKTYTYVYEGKICSNFSAGPNSQTKRKTKSECTSLFGQVSRLFLQPRRKAGWVLAVHNAQYYSISIKGRTGFLMFHFHLRLNEFSTAVCLALAVPLLERQLTEDEVRALL